MVFFADSVAGEENPMMVMRYGIIMLTIFWQANQVSPIVSSSILQWVRSARYLC